MPTLNPSKLAYIPFCIVIEIPGLQIIVGVVKCSLYTFQAEYITVSPTNHATEDQQKETNNNNTSTENLATHKHLHQHPKTKIQEQAIKMIHQNWYLMKLQHEIYRLHSTATFIRTHTYPETQQNKHHQLNSSLHNSHQPNQTTTNQTQKATTFPPFQNKIHSLHQKPQNIHKKKKTEKPF